VTLPTVWMIVTKRGRVWTWTDNPEAIEWKIKNADRDWPGGAPHRAVRYEPTEDA
jgi:hypothetical protein